MRRKKSRKRRTKNKKIKRRKSVKSDRVVTLFETLIVLAPLLGAAASWYAGKKKSTLDELRDQLAKNDYEKNQIRNETEHLLNQILTEK